MFCPSSVVECVDIIIPLLIYKLKPYQTNVKAHSPDPKVT